MNKDKSILLALSCLLVSSCAQNAAWHSGQVTQQEKQTLTIGVVQKDIKKGMTGGQVAEILGSPNIVSTDENGNEVWVYDKFHTESIASGSNGITVGLSNIGAGVARRSQSTITIVIKYDEQEKVRDIAYHKSSF